MFEVGDLVKWIGFPGASLPPEKTGPELSGLVVLVHRTYGEIRYDVAWGDGRMGWRLYEGTIELVQKC